MSFLIVPLLVLGTAGLLFGIIAYLGYLEQKATRITQDAYLGAIRSAKTSWEKVEQHSLGADLVKLSGYGSGEPTAAQRATLEYYQENYATVREALTAAHETAAAAQPDCQRSDLSITELFLPPEEMSATLSVVAPKFDGDIPFVLVVDFEKLEVVTVEYLH